MRAVALLAAAFAAADARACEGKNLAPDKPLHIAVESKPTSACARVSKPGDRLKMHYTGTLYSSCKKFDSSRDRGEPFEFSLGAGEVIKGCKPRHSPATSRRPARPRLSACNWRGSGDEGLRGMCVGEQRKLTIPSDLGYGASGAGDDIPGGATLQFDVELLGFS